MRFLKYILLFLSVPLFSQQQQIKINYADTTITYPLFYSSIDSLNEKKLIAYFDAEFSKKAYEKNYYNGKISGVYRSYYPEGQIHIFQVYQYGVKTGDYAEYNPEGKLIIKAQYKNDQLHGYYIDLIQLRQGRYKNGLKHGKWEYNKGTKQYQKEYFEKGQSISKPSILPKLNLFKSKQAENKDSAELINETTTPTTELNDTIILYGEKDSVKYAIRYLSKDSIDHPTKQKAVYTEKPNQTAVIKYIFQGYQNGIYKVYFPNGQLHLYANYNFGLKDGKFRRYDSNGKLLEEGKYVKNQKNGTWLIRNKEGILKRVKYKNGKLKH